MEGNVKDDLPAMQGPAAQQRSEPDEKTFDDGDDKPNDNSENAGGQDDEQGHPGYAPAVDQVDWNHLDVGLFSDDEDAVMS